MADNTVPPLPSGYKEINTDINNVPPLPSGYKEINNSAPTPETKPTIPQNNIPLTGNNGPIPNNQDFTVKNPKDNFINFANNVTKDNGNITNESQSQGDERNYDKPDLAPEKYLTTAKNYQILAGDKSVWGTIPKNPDSPASIITPKSTLDINTALDQAAVANIDTKTGRENVPEQGIVPVMQRTDIKAERDALGQKINSLSEKNQDGSFKLTDVEAAQTRDDILSGIKQKKKDLTDQINNLSQGYLSKIGHFVLDVVSEGTADAYKLDPQVKVLQKKLNDLNQVEESIQDNTSREASNRNPILQQFYEDPKSVASLDDNNLLRGLQQFGKFMKAFPSTKDVNVLPLEDITSDGTPIAQILNQNATIGKDAFGNPTMKSATLPEGIGGIQNYQDDIKTGINITLSQIGGVLNKDEDDLKSFYGDKSDPTKVGQAKKMMEDYSKSLNYDNLTGEAKKDAYQKLIDYQENIKSQGQQIYDKYTNDASAYNKISKLNDGYLYNLQRFDYDNAKLEESARSGFNFGTYIANPVKKATLGTIRDVAYYSPIDVGSQLANKIGILTDDQTRVIGHNLDIQKNYDYAFMQPHYLLNKNIISLDAITKTLKGQDLGKDANGDPAEIFDGRAFAFGVANMVAGSAALMTGGVLAPEELAAKWGAQALVEKEAGNLTTAYLLDHAYHTAHFTAMSLGMYPQVFAQELKESRELEKKGEINQDDELVRSFLKSSVLVGTETMALDRLSLPTSNPLKTTLTSDILGSLSTKEVFPYLTKENIADAAKRFWNSTFLTALKSPAEELGYYGINKYYSLQNPDYKYDAPTLKSLTQGFVNTAIGMFPYHLRASAFWKSANYKPDDIVTQSAYYQASLHPEEYLNHTLDYIDKIKDLPKYFPAANTKESLKQDVKDMYRNISDVYNEAAPVLSEVDDDNVKSRYLSNLTFLRSKEDQLTQGKTISDDIKDKYNKAQEYVDNVNKYADKQIELRNDDPIKYQSKRFEPYLTKIASQVLNFDPHNSDNATDFTSQLTNIQDTQKMLQLNLSRYSNLKGYEKLADNTQKVLDLVNEKLSKVGQKTPEDEKNEEQENLNNNQTTQNPATNKYDIDKLAEQTNLQTDGKVESANQVLTTDQLRHINSSPENQQQFKDKVTSLKNDQLTGEVASAHLNGEELTPEQQAHADNPIHQPAIENYKQGITNGLREHFNDLADKFIKGNKKATSLTKSEKSEINSQPLFRKVFDQLVKDKEANKSPEKQTEDINEEVGVAPEIETEEPTVNLDEKEEIEKEQIETEIVSNNDLTAPLEVIDESGRRKAISPVNMIAYAGRGFVENNGKIEENTNELHPNFIDNHTTLLQQGTKVTLKLIDNSDLVKKSKAEFKEAQQYSTNAHLKSEDLENEDYFAPIGIYADGKYIGSVHVISYVRSARVVNNITIGDIKVDNNLELQYKALKELRTKLVQHLKKNNELETEISNKDIGKLSTDKDNAFRPIGEVFKNTEVIKSLQIATEAQPTYNGETLLGGEFYKEGGETSVGKAILALPTGIINAEGNVVHAALSLQRPKLTDDNVNTIISALHVFMSQDKDKSDEIAKAFGLDKDDYDLTTKKGTDNFISLLIYSRTPAELLTDPKKATQPFFNLNIYEKDGKINANIDYSTERYLDKDGNIESQNGFIRGVNTIYLTDKDGNFKNEDLNKRTHFKNFLAEQHLNIKKENLGDNFKEVEFSLPSLEKIGNEIEINKSKEYNNYREFIGNQLQTNALKHFHNGEYIYFEQPNYSINLNDDVFKPKEAEPEKTQESREDIEKQREEELKNVKGLTLTKEQIEKGKIIPQREIDLLNQLRAITTSPNFNEAFDELADIVQALSKNKIGSKGHEKYLEFLEFLDQIVAHLGYAIKNKSSNEIGESISDLIKSNEDEINNLPNKLKRNQPEINRINAKYDKKLESLEPKITETQEIPKADIGDIKPVKVGNVSIYEHSIDTPSENDILNGQKDTDLTEKGKEQAHNLGELLKSKGITKLTISPVERAIQTADIIKEEQDIPYEVNDLLKTWNLGSFELKMPDEDFDEKYYVENENEKPNPEAETFKSLRERALEAWKFAKTLPENEVIISHSKMMALMQAYDKTNGEWNEIAKESFLKRDEQNIENEKEVSQETDNNSQNTLKSEEKPLTSQYTSEQLKLFKLMDINPEIEHNSEDFKC